MKTMSFAQSPRNLDLIEVEVLTAQYMEQWNCEDEDAYAASMSGGCDLSMLAPGDPYSTLHYNTATDEFFWKHDNVLREESRSFIGQPAFSQDVYDHGFSERY